MPNRTATEQRTELLGLLERLHRHKDAAYGDAWRKRGEVIAIFANMARKYDRLVVAFDEERPAATEPLADTAGDLCVYAAKYLTWIADEHPDAIASASFGIPEPAAISAARGPDALRTIFDNVAGRPVSAPTAPQAWAHLQATFHELERGLLAQATPGSNQPLLSFPRKARLADNLMENAIDLLAALEREESAALDELRREIRTMDQATAGP